MGGYRTDIPLVTRLRAVVDVLDEFGFIGEGETAMIRLPTALLGASVAHKPSCLAGIRDSG
jgi:hypothetical protein